MTNQTKIAAPGGQPRGDTGDGETGVPEFEQGMSNRPGDKAAPDPKNPAGKPQGTQRDQEKNMESEGQPVRLPADTGRLPDSTDREAKFTKDRAGS